MTRFIAVAGTIGAGKSSLISFLQKHFGFIPFYEKNDDNPFLDDFYRDMKSCAFQSQIYFLTKKFQAHQQIGRLRKPAILDRTIYEDAEVFARHLHLEGIITERELETYDALYRAICRSLPPPDLLIYLKTSLRTQKRRIALRRRPMEAGISDGYLRRINTLYRAWVKTWDRCPLLIIDADRVDFVADLVHQADIITELRRQLRGGSGRAIPLPACEAG